MSIDKYHQRDARRLLKEYHGPKLMPAHEYVDFQRSGCGSGLNPDYDSYTPSMNGESFNTVLSRTRIFGLS